MLGKIKKFVSLILVVSLLLAIFTTVAMAAPGSSQDQITVQGSPRYYNSKGAEVTSSPALGSNSVVSVAKTIEGTDVENEFIMNVEVKTSVDISEISVFNDAAVVLVLDKSGSMVKELANLKTAANNFLDNYVAGAGGSARYAALVTFNTLASITVGWTDVSVPQNLADMKSKINGLVATADTNVQGGLMMARNLLRTEAMPKGTGGEIIGDPAVILFSDGITNRSSQPLNVDYNTGNGVYGNYYDSLAPRDAEGMAYTVKNTTSFTASAYSPRYQKYLAKLYTIGYGPVAPTAWLSTKIATDPSYAYTAANASQLNNVFAAIAERFESWADALVVTDPMGENIDFITNIPQADINSGLLSFENNTLSWDLKKATPNSFANNIYTYNYSYRIRLNTDSSTYVPNVSYPTNGRTELTYVMVTNGVVVSDIMVATFAVPAVKGLIAKSEMPEINAVYAGSDAITGNGIAGAVVTVTLPDGTIVNAVVNSSGRWTIDVPARIDLQIGEVVSAVQQEVGKLVSERTYTTVIEDPSVEPGIDLFVENMSTGLNSAKAGDILLYDVIILNNGNPSSMWESAYVTFTLSSAVRLQENTIRINNRVVTSSQYSFDSAANTLTLYLGDIPGGDGFSISFRATVNSDIASIDQVVLDAELGSVLAAAASFFAGSSIQKSIIYRW